MAVCGNKHNHQAALLTLESSQHRTEGLRALTLDGVFQWCIIATIGAIHFMAATKCLNEVRIKPEVSASAVRVAGVKQPSRCRVARHCRRRAHRGVKSLFRTP